MDRYKGITLIELVVVLALFSLLFSIAIPNFNLLKSYKQDQELREFRRNVLYARNQSVVTGEIHIVKVDYIRNYYNITAGSKTILSHYFENGLDLIENPMNLEEISINELAFGRNGVPVKSGSIYIRLDNGKEFRLSVTPATGKISLYENE